VDTDREEERKKTITWTDTILKDINPINVTWDDICHAVRDRDE